MNRFLLSSLLVLSLIVSACGSPIEEEHEETVKETNSFLQTEFAFMYQYVGGFKNGAGDNAVRIGSCSDGVTVESYGQEAVDWVVDKNEPDVYGDPVISRLSNGNWALTAWSGPEDSRGAGQLLYSEASCPFIDDEEVIVIGASSASACMKTQVVTGAKSSQVFAAEGGDYLIHMINGELYLAHLSDESQSAMDLDSLCMLSTPVTELNDLDYGESTLILSAKESEDIVLSDSAIAQRADGTWVLFAKGIVPDPTCKATELCELCNRSIYRSTSTDLIHWSAPEEVMSQASVPEASNTVDGTVWLYWQDFSNTCEAQDKQLGAIAPISAAYEEAGTYELSEPLTVSFPDEEFEENKQIHYATNANPVLLPDEAAQEAFAACME